MISTSGLVFAFLAALFFSAYGLLSRVLSVKSENPIALSVLYGLFGTFFAIPVLFIEPFSFKAITASVLSATFFATVFYGIQEATQFFMRKYLEASRSTIFFQLTPVVTFIVSILVLDETFSGNKVLGMGLIIAGNLIALYKHGGYVTRRGLMFAFVTVIALGLAYVADKAASSSYPQGLYMMISYFFPAIYMIPLIRGGRISALKKEYKLAGWRLPLLGFVSASGYYFVLKTLRIAEASTAIPIIFTSTILTALGGIIILKERSNITQKLVGAVIVVVGVIILR